MREGEVQKEEGVATFGSVPKRRPLNHLLQGRSSSCNSTSATNAKSKGTRPLSDRR
jgi:hypothetical protein